MLELMSNSRTINKALLAKLLGMLGSSYDGEIASAGRMANDMVRSAGLTWYDVISAPFDKTSYQRDYMRKRRAREKRKSAPPQQ